MSTSVVNRRWVLTSLGASALAACAGRGARRGDRALALGPEIDAAVARAMALDLAPGLGVAVYSRRGVHAEAFGLADIDTRERAGADTAFYVASSTKSMTALALACLHVRREIDLDATLAGFSPAAPLPPAIRPGEVRVRHLLSHTSGIVNEPIEYRFTDSGQHDPGTLWRLLAISQPNAAAPLGRFQYANIGYNIATILTDRKLGVPWQELLQREIFRPAGLARTSASMSHATSSRWSIARPHRLGPSGRRERHYLEKTDPTMHSAGGVIMSVRDAARWLELVVEDGLVGGRRCLPAEVVQSTRTPLADVRVDFEGYRRDRYGLGWYIGTYRDERMLHHFGGFSGFRAHVSYLPDQAIGVAVFSNDSTGGLAVVNAIANYVYDRASGYADAAQRLEAELARAATRCREAAVRIVGERARRASLPLALSRPLAAYAGTYQNDDRGHIEIKTEEPTLRLTCGVLRARAEPLGKPDAVWVELEPEEGAVLQFHGDGAAPSSLTFEGLEFRRTDPPRAPSGPERKPI